MRSPHPPGRCDQRLAERAPLDGFEEPKLEAVACDASQREATGGAEPFCAALRRYHERFEGAEPL